jgi:hypothetical protein
LVIATWSTSEAELAFVVVARGFGPDVVGDGVVAVGEPGA